MYFKAQRLKPLTRYYAFFDDVPVSNWVCVDKVFSDYSDNKNRFNGSPNSEPLGFGMPIVSDVDGNISGVFLIPNGRSPVEGSIFNGSMDDVEYKLKGKSRTFTTGQSSFKLSSSSDTHANLTDITGYAKTDFVSNTVFRDKTDNIVSTRPIEHTTNTTLSEDVRMKFSGTSDSDYNPSVIPAPVTLPRDPFAQTFIVDKNYPEGVFVKELDLFFREKDPYQGVEVYIVSTEGGVPTNKIVPHSRVVKPSDTILRVICSLRTGINKTFIPAGTVIRGVTSKSTGIVKDDVQFDNAGINPTENVENTVYNILISNYLGDFLPGEDLSIEVNPENVNSFSVAGDEYTITRIDITDMGMNYSGEVTVEVSEPDLPGGVNATAVAKVSTNTGTSGKVFDIVLTNSGSGYTKVPSVSIIGSGTKATAVARVSDGRPAVTMGVSTSDDATASTTFSFKSPVYLMGNKTYAFVVKSPTTLKYKLWCSKIGETEIGTLKKVTRQPNMGVVFTSQDTGIWTEDQSLDVKFTLMRSKFNTSVDVGSSLKMSNTPFTYRKCKNNPIVTEAQSDIVKVIHYNHGLLSGDFVHIEGVTGDPGNLSSDLINGLHEVVESDLDEFTIRMPFVFDSVTTSKGGGSEVKTTYNLPYETINLASGVMSFNGSVLRSTNRPLQYGGMKSTPVVVDTPSNYQLSYEGYNESGNYTLDNPSIVPILDTHYYNSGKNVASYLNELKYRDDLHMRREKSMITEFEFSTNDDRVSPVIDLDRTNMTIIHNMIDKQAEYSSIRGNLTPGNAIQSVDVELQRPTKYNSETFNNGSNYAKWISKVFVFDNECDGIEVKLSSIIYELDDIRVFYKTRTIGISDDFSSLKWMPFNLKTIKPGENQRRVDGKSSFIGEVSYTINTNEYKFTPGLADNIDVNKIRNPINVDPRNILSGEWQELVYSVQDIPKFDSVAIKIVMSSSNPALSPLIDDIRLVVSE